MPDTLVPPPGSRRVSFGWIVPPEQLPDAPFVAGSATSHAAANAIRAHRANLLEAVYGYIAAHGTATDEEIAQGTGLNPSTARPRRVELVSAGRIVASGHRLTQAGRRAITWAVAPGDPF